ncbi:MAG: hypothetical protein ACRD3J_28080, partial [Thermoanaerobaculia bacterium]
MTDDLIVDAVALDSIQREPSLRTYDWSPDELLQLTPREIQRAREDALVSHIEETLLQPDPADSHLGAIQRICGELDVALTVIPFAVVNKISKYLARTAAAIREASPQVQWNDYGFGLDKRYSEVLVHLYGRSAYLGRSNFGVERTLFYYEVAASAQVPLMLHPGRRAEALAIANACQDAYAAVRSSVARAFEEPIRQSLSEHGLAWDLSLPPLAEVIVRSAGEQKVSILAVAKQLKASKAAIAFREWLSDLQTDLASNTAAGNLRALKSLAELEKVAASWLTELDIHEQVTHKKRRLELSWV